VLASVGLSFDSDNPHAELRKALAAAAAGAEIITDHSVAGRIAEFQKTLVTNLPTPVSYLTVYELLARHRLQRTWQFDATEALDLIDEQLSRGITLLTIHATATLEAISRHKRSTRRIISTSRGGAAIASILMRSRQENPYWEHFDKIIEIFRRHDATLSLGSTYRPASVCDAGCNDGLYWDEIERMSQLVSRSIAANVPVMIEGIGHAPMHLMQQIISHSKAKCLGVPYRVLSVATDIALGMDHIAGAIAIASAAAAGADLATCVTRAEHLGRPSLEDIVEGVLAARIATHCADIGKIGDHHKDDEMTRARSVRGCGGVISAAIDQQTARKALLKYRKGSSKGRIRCTMCGDACALRQRVNR
jgi:phosphomethylpyrimidine synthase